MNREIGSEFWDAPVVDQENCLFSDKTQWYLSGRIALQAIIKDLSNCRTVALPSWCCDSMIKPFIDAGIDVHFYPVFWEDMLVQDIRNDCDAVLLIDYFGYTNPQRIFPNYRGIIIRDVTHSLFSSSYMDADYYFGSLRKWCGVWTGGFAWSSDGHSLPIEDTNDWGYVRLREKAMRLKKEYFDKKNAVFKGRTVEKNHLCFFEAAEVYLETAKIAPSINRDINIAKKLDVELIKNRRQSNAEVIRSAFREWLIFQDLKETDCPMFVPILVPGHRRDELRKFLIKNDIYCPIHWPLSKYHIVDRQTKEIYNNELSLVCDQRYTKKDMYRIIDTISCFWRHNSAHNLYA